MTPDEAVEFMRKHKILRFETPDGLKIELDPEALVTAAPAEAEDVDAKDLDVVGSTGMTRREQRDLFGSVFEGDFREIPVKPARKKRA